MNRPSSLRTIAVIAAAIVAGGIGGADSGSAGVSVANFAFASSVFSIDEGAGAAEIEVVRTGALEGQAAVHLESGGGTASSKLDYTPVKVDLVFPPGLSSKIVQIQIADDDLAEEKETIRLTLLNPSSAILGSPSTAFLKIVDNDKAVSFAFGSFYCSEGDGIAFVAVRRLGLSTGTDTVGINTANGTATAGVDYQSVGQSIGFTPGETSKFVSIPIIRDSSLENDETVFLTLTAVPAGPPLQDPSSATLTILDDDKLPAASKPAGKIVSVRLTKTSFTVAQADLVKLIFSFHPSSRLFVYALSVKTSGGWMLVNRVKKKGVFAGRKSIRVKKVFGPKPVLPGRYRLKLSADKNSKTLSFTIK